MIKVKIKDIEKIKTWYKDSIIKTVMDRDFDHITANDFEEEITNSLMDETFCSDILIRSVEEIKVRYAWVKQYIETIDFLGNYSYQRDTIKQIHGKSSRKIRSQLLAVYIEKNRNDLIDNTIMSHSSTKNIKDGIDHVCSSMSSFDFFIKDAKKYMEYLNSVIAEKFNYNGVLDKVGIRAELVKKLNIKVCPYCNRQYINSITRVNNTYLGDIDHILPKSTYSLFQLSLVNMIPACKACNQLFKGTKTTPILNPYFEGFSGNAFLKINYSTVKELIGLNEPGDFYWEIVNDKTNKIKNNIDTFQLNEVYKSNSTDFKRIIRIKYLIHSPAYKACISHLLRDGASIFWELFDETLLYGVSLDEDKFQDELLSKAIYDIVMYN